MKTGLMTVHIEVFATLGKARRNKNKQKLRASGHGNSISIKWKLLWVGKMHEALLGS